MTTFFHILQSFLSALVLTILIESVPLIFLSPQKAWLSCGLLCNVLTNPLLNCLRLLFYNLYPNATALLHFTLLLEVLAVVSEGWVYREFLQIRKGKALWISLICNGLSFLISLI